MSVSGLLAGTTLASVIPFGTATIPSGSSGVVVPIPNDAIYGDCVVVATPQPYSREGIQDGTVISAGYGDFASLQIQLSKPTTQAVDFTWAIIYRGTVGNYP